MTLAGALACQRNDVGARRAFGSEARDLCEHRAINREIVIGHPGDGEPLLEAPTHRTTIERDHVAQRPARLVEAGHDSTRDMFIDDLADRAAAEAEDGRAASHRLYHHEAEGLWPIDREEQGARVSEELRLAVIVDLADEFNAGLVEQGCDNLAKIGFIYLVDLGRDLERQAERTRNRYRTIWAFLGRDAAEEGDISAARIVIRRVQVERQAVIDGGDEIRVRYRIALRVRDRDEGHVREGAIERRQIGQVLATMQGGNRAIRHGAEERELKRVDVEMQHGERRRAPAHLIEHDHVMGHIIAHARVEP